MTAIKLTDLERALPARAADAFEGEAKVATSLIRRELMMRVSAGADLRSQRRYPPGCSPGASWPVRATYSE
jgi:hypothetical protein